MPLAPPLYVSDLIVYLLHALGIDYVIGTDRYGHTAQVNRIWRDALQKS
jgi:hypothetical protein